jgi:hypothetical protein
MRPETILQRDLLRHIRMSGFIAVHVPNGATLRGDQKARAIQMRNLKLDGFCVGFPDLIIYASGGRVGHIEVKTGDGKQNDNQEVTQGWLEGLGHNYAVCRSRADVDEAFAAWGWR